MKAREAHELALHQAKTILECDFDFALGDSVIAAVYTYKSIYVYFHIYIYIYMYVFACVCVCACVCVGLCMPL